jgi:phosphonate transport system substrate-binding protein
MALAWQIATATGENAWWAQSGLALGRSNNRILTILTVQKYCIRLKVDSTSLERMRRVEPMRGPKQLGGKYWGRLSIGIEGISRRELLAGFAGLVPASSLGLDFSFGLTPVVLDSDMRLLTLLQRYLMRQLEGPAAVIVRNRQRETVEMLLSGRLDAAWICDLAYVQNKETLTPIAVPLYHGKPFYEGYIVVNEASAARNLEDIRGTQHAFSDPDSASGYLITLWLLGLLHETPASFFQNFFFTYGHRNTIRAVGTGLAESGSVEGYIWEVMKQREPDLVNKTRVVYRSEPLGFPPITVLTASLDRPAIQALARALTGMTSARLGPEILSVLDFDGFTTPGPGLYENIAEKWRVVRTKQLSVQK